MFTKNKKTTDYVFFLEEQSLAPSIFNIKARGLAHSLLDEMELKWILRFERFINELNLIDIIVVQKIILSSWFFSHDLPLSSLHKQWHHDTNRSIIVGNGSGSSSGTVVTIPSSPRYLNLSTWSLKISNTEKPFNVPESWPTRKWHC